MKKYIDYVKNHWEVCTIILCIGVIVIALYWPKKKEVIAAPANPPA